MFHPSTDQLRSILTLGERIASNARRDRSIIKKTRAVEIKKLNDFRRAHPVRVELKRKYDSAAYQAKRETPSVRRNSPESQAIADKALPMLAAGKSQQEVANALGFKHAASLRYHLPKGRYPGCLDNSGRRQLVPTSYAVLKKAREDMDAGIATQRDICRALGMCASSFRDKEKRMKQGLPT